MGRSTEHGLLAAELEANTHATLAKKARAHTDLALGALVDVAEMDVEPRIEVIGDGKQQKSLVVPGAPAGPKVSAAKALLEHGYGKAPQTREGVGTDTGITVIINQYGPGAQPIERVIDAEVVNEELKAADVELVIKKLGADPDADW